MEWMEWNGMDQEFFMFSCPSLSKTQFERINIIMHETVEIP